MCDGEQDLPGTENRFTGRVHRRDLTPGEHYPVLDREWRGALAILATGEIEVITRHGARRRFTAGAMLALVELDIVEIVNTSTDSVAVLLALHRVGTRPPAGGV